MTKLYIGEILIVILCAMSIAGFYNLYREMVNTWEGKDE